MDANSQSDGETSRFRAELGRRISSVADALGTRTNAAAIAGVSPDQLQLYIKGKGKVSLAPVARMAAAAGVSLDWVWCGEGEMYIVGRSMAAEPSRAYRVLHTAPAAGSTVPAVPAVKLVKALAAEFGLGHDTDAQLMLVEQIAGHHMDEHAARCVLRHLKSMREEGDR